jgi:flavin reductase (DIM6/NTAB) family NADH-FMN oxidoreductase RutF
MAQPLNVMTISWLTPANNYGGVILVMKKSRYSAQNLFGKHATSWRSESEKEEIEDTGLDGVPKEGKREGSSAEDDETNTPHVGGRFILSVATSEQVGLLRAVGKCSGAAGKDKFQKRETPDNSSKEPQPSSAIPGLKAVSQRKVGLIMRADVLREAENLASLGQVEDEKETNKSRKHDGPTETFLSTSSKPKNTFAKAANAFAALDMSDSEPDPGSGEETTSQKGQRRKGTLGSDKGKASENAAASRVGCSNADRSSDVSRGSTKATKLLEEPLEGVAGCCAYMRCRVQKVQDATEVRRPDLLLLFCLSSSFLLFSFFLLSILH